MPIKRNVAEVIIKKPNQLIQGLPNLKQKIFNMIKIEQL
jgi:hypothetical protein